MSAPTPTFSPAFCYLLLEGFAFVSYSAGDLNRLHRSPLRLGARGHRGLYSIMAKTKDRIQTAQAQELAPLMYQLCDLC